MFIKIKEEYLQYLKKYESRIPNQDYGEGKYKPFYILTADVNSKDVLYVTQVTSPKPRHEKLRESIDFVKIIDSKSEKLISATNLNYMFPILREDFQYISYQEISELTGSDSKGRLLRRIANGLRAKNLEEKHLTLMELKYKKPNAAVSMRSLDFKQLEAKMLEFKLNEQFYDKDIKVERSDDYSTFFVETPNNMYDFNEDILNNVYDFFDEMSLNMQFEATYEQDLERMQLDIDMMSM